MIKPYLMFNGTGEEAFKPTGLGRETGTHPKNTATCRLTRSFPGRRRRRIWSSGAVFGNSRETGMGGA